MKMNTLKKSLLLWALIFAIVFAVLVTSTFAWFVFNDEVQLSSPADENLAVQVNAGDLKISYSILTTIDEEVVFSDYSQFGSEFDIITEMPKYIDVTGNGTKLYFPKNLYEDDNGNIAPDYDNGDDWIEVQNALGYVVVLKLKFSTTQSMSVFLDDNSYVSPIDTDLTGDGIVHSSSFGHFSADGIAGAVRVSFSELTSSGTEQVETLKNIWIPNDTFCLGNINNSTYTFTPNGEREAQYKYWILNTQSNRMTQRTYSENDYANGSVTVGKYDLAKESTKCAYGSTPLLTFEANGFEQEKELLLRVWFEGTDREADKALDGGYIKYLFSFTGIDKEAVSTAEQTAVDNIYYASNKLRWNDGSLCETQIQISYDCIEWTDYGINATLDSNKTYVYVRSCETTKKRVSAAHIVPLT